jgi:hypothetical protein
MKPRSSSDRSRNGSDRSARRFPITDCDYQAPSYIDRSGGHCANVPTPSFRNISRDYFRSEARYTYAGEAAFFALITVTAALAIASSAAAALGFLRALGYL